MERINPDIPNKILYLPSKNSYELQEQNYRIDEPAPISELSEAKQKFFLTKTGKKFLSYRKELLFKFQGLNVWSVDGCALRGGKECGDVDFSMAGHGYRYMYIPENEIWVDEVYVNTGDYRPTFFHEYTELCLMKKENSYLYSHVMASKIEEIWRGDEYRILPVRNYRQMMAGTCGFASLKILLDYLRFDIEEEKLIELSGLNPEDGIDSDYLVELVNHLGFQCYSVVDMAVEQVKNLINNGQPIIVNYQSPDEGQPTSVYDGHYSVLCGYSDSKFVLSDPAEDEGYREIYISKFLEQWYEIERGWNFNRQGIIVSRID